ncbi:hypothetical protein BpHYR1_034243, partial [Brachionus plicatilis]
MKVETQQVEPVESVTPIVSVEPVTPEVFELWPVKGISRDAYINPNKYCWLHSLFAIFGALVPIAIILLINLVLFVMIGLSHSNVIKKRNKYLHKKENLDEKGVKQE